MIRSGYTYIVASQRNGTIYIGVTSNLEGRAYEHRHGLIEGFSKKYECKLLVWYDNFSTIGAAIDNEKRLKEWRRSWKLELIEAQNPTWRDLSIEFLGPDESLK